jgi:hypothetical protein
MVAPPCSKPCIPSWFDRKDEWNKCIVHAMGYEWVGEEEDEPIKQQDAMEESHTFQVLNLLNVNDDDEEKDDDEHYHGRNFSSSTHHHHHHDLWMESAERIQTDIDQMSKWIRDSLQYSLARVDLPVDEATLVSSTVTSFCATTAKEIEMLRKLTQQEEESASSKMSQSIIRHRSGIVQILLGRLQEQVVEPFAKLQKQRQRKAIDLWQHPLQCCWSRSRGSNGPDVADQRFMPGAAPPPQELYDFLVKYKQTETIPVPVIGHGPPVSKLFSAATSKASAAAATPTTKPAAAAATSKWGRSTPKQPTTAPHPAIMPPYDPDSDYPPIVTTATPQEELQREAVLLLAQYEHSDLDTVQKMEERMVEITTLLTQFAALVTEQQEDIVQIHQATVSSQENLVKGKESLVDATERTKRSKHYMATMIAILGVLLWFWNTLRP